VLSTADKIITITPFYVMQFKSIAQRPVSLLPNGFDEDDFKNITYKKSDKFLIRHVGIINEKCDPRPFIIAFREVMNEQIDFANNVSLEFIGEVYPSFMSFIENDEVVSRRTILTGNIPHKDLLLKYGESSLLLLVLNGYKDAEGYMPGKLFEYIATGIPVLGVGPPDGDAASLLKETKGGKMLEASNIEGIKSHLVHEFNEWKNARQITKINPEVLKYSRKEITRSLTELL
jgi:glycosyltransferase involved in cell wall biosynthesis